MTESSKTVYVLDTSAILDCWERYYPPDVFPGLYKNIEQMIADEKLISPDEIYRELEKKDDAAFAWAKRNRTMFLPLDNATQIEVAAILGSHPLLIQAGGRRSGGDPFVVAVAKVFNGVVVTAEKDQLTQKRVTIPRVCSELGIRCLQVIEFIRERKWVFR